MSSCMILLLVLLLSLLPWLLLLAWLSFVYASIWCCWSSLSNWCLWLHRQSMAWFTESELYCMPSVSPTSVLKMRLWLLGEKLLCHLNSMCCLICFCFISHPIWMILHWCVLLLRLLWLFCLICLVHDLWLQSWSRRTSGQTISPTGNRTC